jgi:hypothetical protein
MTNIIKNIEETHEKLLIQIFGYDVTNYRTTFFIKIEKIYYFDLL